MKKMIIMDNSNFTLKSTKKIFTKPKSPQLLVFDIETVPLEEGNYSATQLNFIQKKLKSAQLRNPNLDIATETSKICGTDPYLASIVCIGLFYPLNGQSIALTNVSEKAILESFWDQLKKYSGIFISFNGVRFDVPFILKRSLHHGVKPSNMTFLQHTKYNTYPPHYDVMLQMGRENIYSLKEACDFFGVPSSKEGEVKAESVAQAYKEGRINEIAEYCLRDLNSTYLLYDKLRSYTTNS